MGKKIYFSLLMGMLVFAFFASAQETTVKGNFAGVVQDESGAVIPGAKVSLTGPTGNKSSDTDNEGKFLFPLLTPGSYAVKVEKNSFKTAEVKGVEVLAGRTAQLTLKMQAGATTETLEVTADATTVDTTSSAVGANLSDQFYNAVPIQRNVANLFYTAPGVADGGGTGRSNPSISGATGLENLYVADGVKITDSAFGGLGVFTRAQGSIGTGINLSFIKEVDVKTGGFEPQYGQADGGVVQIITKSGSDKYHGALALYAAPEFFRAHPRFRDDFRVNKIGKLEGVSQYESSVELGGYVPGFRDHLFFFGSFDPTWNHNFLLPPPGSGIAAFGEQNQRFNTMNWSGKLTYKVDSAEKHKVEFSAFGDPAYTNTAQLNGTLNRANTTGYSRWNYGTKNVVTRYNGTLTPTWLLNGSASWGNDEFKESPLSNVFQITDRTGNPGTIVLQGFGLLENHNSNTFATNVDTSKVFRFAGDHTFSIGYRYENQNYDNIKGRSGGRYVVPGVNASGTSPFASNISFNPVGRLADSAFSLRATTAACTLCPLYPVNGVLRPVFLQVIRGEFGRGGLIPTEGQYHAAYFNDSWTFNRFLTVSAGLRWEQHHIAGTDVKYTFTDNWSPRIGLTLDPFGDRKSKIYANYGRYSFPLSLDAAIRSLSTELDLNNLDFAPVINGTTVTPVLDSAHVLNRAVGGVSQSAGAFAAGFDPTIPAPYFVVPGTKMTYEEEFVIGAERQYKGIVFSARYLDRRLRRIIEDMGGISPEGASAGLNQISVLGNPSPTLDTFVNEKQIVFPQGAPNPAGCAGDINRGGNISFGPNTDVLGNVFTQNNICFPNASVAGNVGADGIPDGFVKPIRHYSAWEFEANKAFSHNYLLRLNYRYAQLFGNYEGAFRNDNGQTDPGISSLFDFTAGNFNLLGDQFKPGFLNTDRRHVFNGSFSYTFDRYMTRGLTVGTNFRVQQGTPLSLFANHPVYQNAGEVPLGGRGTRGRTPKSGNVDLKLEYPRKLGERYTMRFGADLFNVFNWRKVATLDQNRDLSGQPANSNVDFNTPLTFQTPFFARFSFKIDF